MNKSLDRTVLVLVWLKIVVGILAFAGAKFFVMQRDDHIKAMGKACVHHVHNLSASANANLKDFYSAGIADPGKYKIQATLECLQRYPLYSGGETYSGFNTSLN